jgi:ArsR family transcriptional regulator
VEGRAAEGAARSLWLLVRGETETSVAAKADARRLRGILAARRSRSEEFFRSEAGRWDRLRDDLFGEGFFLAALPALVDPTWTVGDLGCGTGRVAEAIAPYVARVVAVDGSDAMLRAARKRLRGFPGVEVRQGALESLPVDDGSLDAATLVLVLHHVAEPARVLHEAVRALAPGGRLLVVDMFPHDREEYRRSMGHVWLGFAEDTAARALEEAGLQDVVLRPLATAEGAKGPSLFVARGVKPREVSKCNRTRRRRSVA